MNQAFHSRSFTRSRLALAVILVSLFIGPRAQAQHLELVYTFTGGTDQKKPNSLILASDGSLVGTTALISTPMWGTIFKVTNQGNYTLLHAFASDGTEGQGPTSLFESGGILYGAANHGGKVNGFLSDVGTVYSLGLNGSNFTLLNQTFNAGAGCTNPVSIVLDTDSSIYGATNPESEPNGTLFKLGAANAVSPIKLLYGNIFNQVILGPDTQGDLYGSIQNGGINGAGSVFQSTTAGVLIDLVDMNYSDTTGYTPAQLLLGKDKNFYGTTTYGGANSVGTLFKVVPNGTNSAISAFATFSSALPGGSPSSLIQGADGTFYGTMENGGPNGTGDGTVYKVSPAGVITVLASFDNGPIGQEPSSLVIGSDGNLYGTTLFGGANGDGTVFRVNLAVDPLDGSPQGNGINYSPWFGYYLSGSYPLVYQYYLGYEYVYPTNTGATLYDYASGHFWYTDSSYFPNIYDYTLNTFLYYYSANTPHRHFYDYNTGKVITE